MRASDGKRECQRVLVERYDMKRAHPLTSGWIVMGKMKSSSSLKPSSEMPGF